MYTPNDAADGDDDGAPWLVAQIHDFFFLAMYAHRHMYDTTCILLMMMLLLLMMVLMQVHRDSSLISITIALNEKVPMSSSTSY